MAAPPTACSFLCLSLRVPVKREGVHLLPAGDAGGPPVAADPAQLPVSADRKSTLSWSSSVTGLIGGEEAAGALRVRGGRVGVICR